ncbi:MAG: sigma-54 dependent transcriptional regulator [Myxococcota bacterium]
MKKVKGEIETLSEKGALRSKRELRKILVIEDEKLIRWSLEKKLKKEGFDVFCVETGREGLDSMGNVKPNAILLDLKLPDMNGLDVLKEIRKLCVECPVIIITAHGDIQTAVTSIKLGAYDFIKKPFELEEVILTLSRALDAAYLKSEVDQIHLSHRAQFNFDSFITVSPRMKNAMELIKRIAESNSTTILIQGESGVGKDLVARIIHYNSARYNAPFIDVNCAAIPDTLVESELFGYEKGAFTGAEQVKKGLLEMADKGAILLDEIGDMPLVAQSKLLHVLDENTFRRVGGTKNISVNIRVIATTNKNLEEMVKERRFREDLYFRLRVVPIFIPPLRERPEDIIKLAEHFISRFNTEFRREVRGLSKDAEKVLLSYSFPGNVRELRNIVEYAYILGATDQIMTEHLPLNLFQLKERIKESIKLPPSGLSLEEVERQLIVEALQRAEGNQTKAAKLLGLTRDTLRYRMKKFNLSEK